jgi:hypothetical protein
MRMDDDESHSGISFQAFHLHDESDSEGLLLREKLQDGRPTKHRDSSSSHPNAQCSILPKYS